MRSIQGAFTCISCSEISPTDPLFASNNCSLGTLVGALFLLVEECAYRVILCLYRFKLHLEGPTEGVDLVFGEAAIPA